MPAVRNAVLILSALVCAAHADTITYLTQQRSVDALLEFSPDGGSPTAFQSGASTSNTGWFDENATAADSGYASSASQHSQIHSLGVLADGSASLGKPLLGGDLTAHQTVLSSLVVEFSVLADTLYYLNANFTFNADTGGMITASGAMSASLSGVGGDIFEQANSFPTPDSFADIDFASSGVLAPGTYTLSIDTEIALTSLPYEIGGDALASYQIDFGLVPEPAGALLLTTVSVIALRRRR